MTGRAETAASSPLLGNLNLALNFRAISLLEGLRAAVAVAVTMAAGAWFGLPQLNIAALGALLACFVDPGGPIAARLPPMLIFGLLGGAAFGLFPLLLAANPTGAIVLASAAIFAASLARIYGQGGMQTGNLVSVAIVLALDRPVFEPLFAAKLGFAFAAGAVWASALTLALWRFRPYAPARAALAQIARALADLVRDLDALSGRAGERDYDRHAMRHRRAVRDAIEQARAISLATFRRRGAASARANQITLRLATLDRVFEALIALSAVFDETNTAAPSTHRALRRIVWFLASVAPDLEADRKLVNPERSRELETLHDRAPTEPDPRVRQLLATIADRLTALLSVTARAGADPTLAETAPGLRARITAPLRANLTWDSAPLRHAVRTAVVILPVLMLVERLDNPFGHWLAITVILTTQPHFSATWARAAERVAGTIAGGVLAALIGLVCVTQSEIALSMIPLTLVAFAIRGVNYSLYIAVLTPMIVLLIEQVMPGASQLTVAMSRVGFTFAGGVLAVGANLLLWPSFEANRLDAATRAAIAAHRDYLRAALATLGSPQDRLPAERRAAGLASNNLEASINRALAEPHRDDDPDLRRAVVVDAALRRMAGRLASLGIAGQRLEAAEHSLLPAWSAHLTAVLDGAPPPPSWPPAPAPIAESLTRLARQAELIGAELGATASIEDNRS